MAARRTDSCYRDHQGTCVSAPSHATTRSGFYSSAQCYATSYRAYFITLYYARICTSYICILYLCIYYVKCYDCQGSVRAEWCKKALSSIAFIAFYDGPINRVTDTTACKRTGCYFLVLVVYTIELFSYILL